MKGKIDTRDTFIKVQFTLDRHDDFNVLNCCGPILVENFWSLLNVHSAWGDLTWPRSESRMCVRLRASQRYCWAPFPCRNSHWRRRQRQPRRRTGHSIRVCAAALPEPATRSPVSPTRKRLSSRSEEHTS